MSALCDLSHTPHSIGRLAVTAALALALCACVDAPPPRPHPARVAQPPPPPVNTTVYAYPLQGQSQDQLERDRYECYLWASKQTGFDPSAPGVPPAQRVRVVGGPPPGAGTLTGAATGAVLGAAVSNPWHSGEGALIGAVIGGALGATADAARAHNVEQAQADANAHQQAQSSQYEQRATDYRRALGACLEGRGYSVK